MKRRGIKKYTSTQASVFRLKKVGVTGIILLHKTDHILLVNKILINI
jgi:hypothetical protein